MKTNSGWIKTDYRVQTAFGLVIAGLVASGLLSGLLSLIGWDSGAVWSFFAIYFILLLFIPLGLWQVISGIIHAFNGDKLQKIYLFVVVIYFSIGFIYVDTSYHLYDASYFLVPMAIAAVVIAVWKYTVVRADFISLDIIDVQKVASDGLLDA